MTDDLAAGLVADAHRSLPQPLGVDPVALAWALKAVCFAAWSTAPARAVRCATLLTDLLARVQAQPQAGQAHIEVAAVAHWVQGDRPHQRRPHGSGLRQPGCRAGRLRGAAAAAACRPDPCAQGDGAVAAWASMTPPCAAAWTRCSSSSPWATELAAGKIEVNLGTLATRQDRHADAARLFRSAAVRGARARDRSLSIHADIALANALTWLSDFDEAMRINRRARNARRDPRPGSGRRPGRWRHRPHRAASRPPPCCAARAGGRQPRLHPGRGQPAAAHRGRGRAWPMPTAPSTCCPRRWRCTSRW